MMRTVKNNMNINVFLNKVFYTLFAALVLVFLTLQNHTAFFLFIPSLCKSTALHKVVKSIPLLE